MMMVLIVVGEGSAGENSEREKRGEEQQVRDTFHENPTRSEFSRAVGGGSNIIGGRSQAYAALEWLVTILANPTK